MKEVLKEGFELMIVDLTIQLSLTITIYVAATQSFEIAYKLSAAQAAYWGFGPQYLIGMMLFFKLLGAKFIASKEYRAFISLFAFMVLLTISLFISAILAAINSRYATAYSYGQSACIFATDPNCVNIYAGIFQSTDSLNLVFEAFGPTVGLQLLFILMRGGIAVCHDFRFMAIASLVTFIFVYIPMIIIIRVVPFGYTSTLYYVAMYMPHFVLVVVFGIRLVINLVRLNKGEPGPWTHAQRLGDFEIDDPSKSYQSLY